MGFHICEFCQKGTKTRFSPTSSGDVNLTFTNGHRWVMPDMILHYVADHRWLPPQEFINDIMTMELLDSGRRQTRSISSDDVMTAQQVGYLTGSFTKGEVPDGFVKLLEILMMTANKMDYRTQTKEIVYR